MKNSNETHEVMGRGFSRKHGDKRRQTTRKPNYETDDATFNADAYRVMGYDGIAWYARGWETEPDEDEDTSWSGIENRTGKVVMTMVGDDRRFSFDLDEIAPLDREEYCAECGQIGCRHDGLIREA